jgi:2-polyprenyl-3-methyl-5-hydroxy-6-metoxy-1,4-benzoquinol methylase
VSEHRWQKDNDRNVRLYSERIAQHGYDVRALGWGSRESQARRFAVLGEVGKLTGRSVLDVGCGLGDLYAWMRRKRLRVRYTGVDITPGMVDKARARFPRTQFRVCDVLDHSQPVAAHDYVLSSGIFTHHSASASEFLEAMVRRMFDLSKQGLAFNCLSGWAERKERGEYHADPLKVVSLCRKLTTRVVLRHDYHPRDFTVYLYKNVRT